MNGAQRSEQLHGEDEEINFFFIQKHFRKKYILQKSCFNFSIILCQQNIQKKKGFW